MDSSFGLVVLLERFGFVAGGGAQRQNLVCRAIFDKHRRPFGDFLPFPLAKVQKE